MTIEEKRHFRYIVHDILKEVRGSRYYGVTHWSTGLKQELFTLQARNPEGYQMCERHYADNNISLLKDSLKELIQPVI
jgi:hypothetical protein